MPSFAQRLIAWQRTHGRHDLPWQVKGGTARLAQTPDAPVPSHCLLPQSAGFARNVSEADAYRVWLSEVMLQQTQVATVIPYFQRFVAAFPDVAALAAATEDQVLAHWSGLGYYARGRNLHKAAQLIVERHRGEFPQQFEQIVELPGIGRSTAAAVCALAFHQRRAILDGNVKRVLARYCGIEGWAGEKKVEERLWKQAEALLPLPEAEGASVDRSADIAIYTQALMDMGATVCTRSKPRCVLCPVQADCVALQTDRITQLPAPRPKKAVPERHAVFLLLMHGNDILLEKRPGSGIWGGLWCPPQFEDEDTARDWFGRHGMEASGGERLETFTHTFTHFKLHLTPLRIQLARKPLHAAEPGSVWLEVGEALGGAIPTPVRAMLNKVARGQLPPLMREGVEGAQHKRLSGTEKLKSQRSTWICYLLHCADQTLYCGITNNLEKRLAAHNSREGAKYTRGRTPVILLYSEPCADKSAALKREMQIKSLSRADKLALCGVT